MEQEQGDSISLDCTPSPPLHHEKWKRAHKRKGSEFTSEATHEVAEKIDVFVKQSKAGLFVSLDLHDILVEAIRTEEHHGCVCGLGRGVGFKTYFGRSRSTKEVHSKEVIEDIVFIKLAEEREKWIQEERQRMQMEEWERVLQEESERLL
ncbi:unnamed protein product [Lathyrus oleraceus]